MTANLTLRSAPRRYVRYLADSRTTAVSTAVNAAFFQELKEDHWELREILESLNRLLNNPLQLQRRCRLVALLRRLRDQLALHFTLEEAYGYFHDPIAVAPELSALAESLEAEHGTLYTQLDEILDHADYVAYDKACKSLWLQVVQRVRAFCDQLQEHESRENALILQVHNDELGVGD